LQKVCRVVCEWEEVKKVTYCCEAEDFCVPGPSHKCGCHDIPTCGKVRTRNTLVKKEEVHRTPKYRCVVEYLCPGCCNLAASPVPPAAAATAKISAAEFAAPAAYAPAPVVRVHVAP
jgi:hypothetical protein